MILSDRVSGKLPSWGLLAAACPRARVLARAGRSHRSRRKPLSHLLFQCENG